MNIKELKQMIKEQMEKLNEDKEKSVLLEYPTDKKVENEKE
jgi:hypothetical protein